MKSVEFESRCRRGGCRVQLEGADAGHTVEDVVFENMTILSQPLTRTTPGVSIGKNVGNVRFERKP